jgi:hypothetical protein
MDLCLKFYIIPYLQITINVGQICVSIQSTEHVVLYQQRLNQTPSKVCITEVGHTLIKVMFFEATIQAK